MQFNSCMVHGHCSLEVKHSPYTVTDNSNTGVACATETVKVLGNTNYRLRSNRLKHALHYQFL